MSMLLRKWAEYICKSRVWKSLFVSKLICGYRTPITWVSNTILIYFFCRGLDNLDWLHPFVLVFDKYYRRWCLISISSFQYRNNLFNPISTDSTFISHSILWQGFLFSKKRFQMYQIQCSTCLHNYESLIQSRG